MEEIIYEWIQTIEAVVRRHTIVKPVIGKSCGEVSKGWIFELIFRLGMCDRRSKEADGVMGFAYWTGLILLSWYFRTHFAKTCDPRRPKKDREDALHQLVMNMEPLFGMMDLNVTEKDKEIYKQEWEPIELK